ncbi:3-hydroxyacyl-ACP dehydratase FabZ family protein [Flavobacterium sp. NRK1]|uniref:3-hydroxyacyl-ACP dehydratase FabZ family protein n=1 Tax=Flavobacterium sp. NRK1 TaxID=2954929 RepID=UPI0020938028|nr:beta-hydroxyacyl-ACP dehydratase [Flavobacterium sp. NRK1]MCO6148047.1 beta-hydroxyacyl-ACP dehydratase [Flavobacterium sp. NRK1]
MEGTNRIEELIPHRYPFLFVDEILSVNKEEIIGVTTFNDGENPLLESSYVTSGIIPGTIILEAMAQCGGAGVRLLGIAEGVFALAHVQTTAFFKAVHYDEQVKFIIKNIRLSAKIVKQQGSAYVNDDLVMEASWMSIKIDTSMLTADK